MGLSRCRGTGGCAFPLVVAGLVALSISLALPRAAQATFPGTNGRIVMGADPYMVSVNPDGTGRLELGEGHSPAWSPDGSRIAFVRLLGPLDARTEALFVMNSDGGSQAELTWPSYPTSHTEPDWSPDGATGPLPAGALTGS